MSKINSILIFPQKSEEKNKYMDDMGPSYVYLTDDAWVSGPDLAPQKFLLSQ